VSVAGNLKFDVRVVEESDATRLLKSRTSGLRLVVAGSTLEGEEAALLEVWPRLLLADPRLAMVLAPRHPERFEAVAGLLGRSGVPWVRRSAWTGKPPESVAPLGGGQIVLLDTIGELASVYSIASVAFVGGSLVQAGGHNPLEPAQFGVPIVMGPHYANFRSITKDLLAHDAISITEKGKLAQVLIELLNDRETARAMGERARQVFDQQSGATERCVGELKSLLIPPGTRYSIPRPVDPAVEREAVCLKNDGAGTEAILKFLRERGCGKIDSVKILRSIYGIGLAQAKGIVDSSDVWKDRLGPDAMLHEELWLELERASKSPGSGIKESESGFVIHVSDDIEKE
jgi:hypothetical protein